MSGAVERALAAGAPAVAMATVALGLRLGASDAVRAAVVYGAADARAGTGLAWQVVVFDEDRNLREPAAHLDVALEARAGGAEARGHGRTNEDGVAEVRLPIAAEGLHLEVRSGTTVLASGDVRVAPATPPVEAASAWAPYARRDGAVALDVAVLGGTVAAGFPAHLWVHATDAATGRGLDGVAVTPEAQTSFVPAAVAFTSDERGWAHVVATPVGHAVEVTLNARARSGETGTWVGNLFISPGAAAIALDDRVAPGAEAVIDVTVPTARTTAYLEVDDAHGRAWAAAVPVAGPEGQLPRGAARVPPLGPGLYWAVVADDAASAATLGPGTAVRPFFVAASDEAGLAFGPDPSACAPPGDPRDVARTVARCLALVVPAPTPRWLALEGFAMKHANDGARRRLGLAVAVGGVVVALLLEALLLVRAARMARARLRAASEDALEAPVVLTSRAGAAVVAVLVALLGLALLAAFLLRLG